MLISHRSWRKCTPCLWSSAGRSRHSARHSTSLYSTWLNEWRAWDVQIKAGLAKSNLKNRVSGKLHGGRGGGLRGASGSGTGRHQRLLITGLLEDSYQGFTFACASAGCYYRRGQCQFRVPTGHLAKQNGC